MKDRTQTGQQDGHEDVRMSSVYVNVFLHTVL